jgi:uracil-DNA glycosylase
MSWLDTAWLRRGKSDKDESGYNARRSAFWRVNQKILAKLDITDAKDWYHHLYWTNLYKVAPHSGGNPSNALIRAQQAACNDILKEEIKNQKPRRILMLTSKSWANLFIENNVVASEHKPLLKYIDFIGYWKNGDTSIPVVIAEHPQGRKEDLLASNVCNAFSLLSA